MIAWILEWAISITAGYFAWTRLSWWVGILVFTGIQIIGGGRDFSSGEYGPPVLMRVLHQLVIIGTSIGVGFLSRQWWAGLICYFYLLFLTGFKGEVF